MKKGRRRWCRPGAPASRDWIDASAEKTSELAQVFLLAVALGYFSTWHRLKKPEGGQLGVFRLLPAPAVTAARSHLMGFCLHYLEALPISSEIVGQIHANLLAVKTRIQLDRSAEFCAINIDEKVRGRAVTQWNA